MKIPNSCPINASYFNAVTKVGPFSDSVAPAMGMFGAIPQAELLAEIGGAFLSSLAIDMDSFEKVRISKDERRSGRVKECG